MRLLLHIFWKDSRRLWGEILISLAIAVAFVRVYPVMWVGDDSMQMSIGGFTTYQRMHWLAEVLVVLVPASWGLLVARVVHGESLVGDRQWWVTRPYDRRVLLGAKWLFIAAYICLPFLLMQAGLLAEAGFNPAKYVPGLLYSLLLMTGILVVPLFALAAVTKNFMRMLLTLLGVLAGIAGIAYLVHLIEPESVSVPGGDRISIPVILLVCGSAILVQYAVRKVWLARMLLLSVAVVLTAVAASPTNFMSMETAYPAPKLAGETAPVIVSVDASKAWPKTIYADAKTRNVSFHLPIMISGVERDRAAILDDVMMVVEGANGQSWSSPWRSVYNERFLRGGWDSGVDVEISRLAYEKFKGAPVTVHVRFAVTETKAGQVTQMVWPQSEFEVPGLGICPGWEGRNNWDTVLSCRTALHSPELMYVTAVAPVGGCAQPHGGLQDSDEDSEYEDGADAQGSWVGGLDNDPADFGITSVWTANFVASAGRDAKKRRWNCPGSTLSFTRFELVRRTQVEMTMRGVTLPALDSQASPMLLYLK